MPRGKSIIVATMWGLALSTTAQAKNLEDLIDGKFKAAGTNRVKPDQPAERILCHLTGRRIDAQHLQLAGRCATASQSGSIVVDFTVLSPGARYRMDIAIKTSEFHGYQAAYHYSGVARGTQIAFTAPFTFEGTDYRSDVHVSYGSGWIDRIIETVTAKETGKRTVLIDLRVRRE